MVLVSHYMDIPCENCQKTIQRKVFCCNSCRYQYRYNCTKRVKDYTQQGKESTNSAKHTKIARIVESIPRSVEKPEAVSVRIQDAVSDHDPDDDVPVGQMRSDGYIQVAKLAVKAYKRPAQFNTAMCKCGSMKGTCGHK